MKSQNNIGFTKMVAIDEVIDRLDQNQIKWPFDIKTYFKQLCEQSLGESRDQKSEEESKKCPKTRTNSYKSDSLMYSQNLFSPQTSLPSYYSVCSENDSSDGLSDDLSDDSNQSSSIGSDSSTSDSISVFSSHSSFGSLDSIESQSIVGPTLRSIRTLRSCLLKESNDPQLDEKKFKTKARVSNDFHSRVCSPGNDNKIGKNTNILVKTLAENEIIASSDSETEPILQIGVKNQESLQNQNTIEENNWIFSMNKYVMTSDDLSIDSIPSLSIKSNSSDHLNEEKTKSEEMIFDSDINSLGDISDIRSDESSKSDEILNKIIGKSSTNDEELKTKFNDCIEIDLRSDSSLQKCDKIEDFTESDHKNDSNSLNSSSHK